jgi:lipoprotein-anchoring transpeptidase ErfK/SrfK
MLWRTLAVVSALSTLTSGTDAAVVITIDKNTQTMSVAVDGQERHSWPVSTGRPGYSTPTGSFTAFRMAKEHYSKEWDDAPMPHSIFFTQRGHAIHGSLETRRLGNPASHGCVRLAPANAETLFNLVKADGLSTTKVVITGEDKAVPVAERIRNSTRAA